jgi:hypothetical protein
MALFVIGLAIGILVGLLLSMTRSDGDIVIDDSDELVTKWHLIVKTEPEKVKEKRAIRLMVRIQ